MLFQTAAKPIFSKENNKPLLFKKVENVYISQGIPLLNYFDLKLSLECSYFKKYEMFSVVILFFPRVLERCRLSLQRCSSNGVLSWTDAVGLEKATPLQGGRKRRRCVGNMATAQNLCKQARKIKPLCKKIKSLDSWIFFKQFDEFCPFYCDVVRDPVLRENCEEVVKV